jgi:hypothetical protein
MNAGKKTSRITSYLFYGIAAAATAGTGTFVYRYWTRLEQEPARAAVTPATSPVAIQETELPPDHPLRLANEKVKSELDLLAAQGPKSAPKLAGDAAPRSTAAAAPGNTRGQITMIGKAGKMTAVAPATDQDRASNTFQEAYTAPPPATYGPGPQFYTTEDKDKAARDAEARRIEEERRARKAAEDADPKWQRRVDYK